MTRDEAIKRLKDTFEAWDIWVKKCPEDAPARLLNEALGMAIAALRVTDTVTETVTDSHQLETVTKCHDTDGCEYCRESENIYYHAGEVNALDELLYITGDDLVVDIGCRFYLVASIKFCPMCGRRLEEV